MNIKINADFKKKLREEMKQRLLSFHGQLSQREKHALAEQLCQHIISLTEYKNAGIVFAYIPAALEADCMPVILDALESRKRVAVPKIDAASLKNGLSEMNFYYLEAEKPLAEQLSPGTYGIGEPESDLKKVNLSELSGVVFVIVPGVAFTLDGKRLGHGKAFYDIFIARMRQAGANLFLCGASLPCQIVAELPAETHDVLMDKVVF